MNTPSPEENFFDHIIINLETIAHPSLPTGLLPSLDDFDAPANYKDHDKIIAYKHGKLDEAKEKLSLSPLTNMVVCVSALQVDQESEKSFIQTGLGKTPDEEKALLEVLATIIANNPASVIISYNGKAFDIPMLYFGLARHNLHILDLPSYRAMISKYSTLSRHVDVYETLSSNGNFKKGSLADWCIRMGIDPPVHDGKDIANFFKLGDMDSIKAHCESNVVATWKLYQRLARSFDIRGGWDE